ncbi:MAG: chemotaxis protein CheW [Acidobacteriota bacterium]|nr:chemotaxis protein CheW [Acidobacteriota bacterium]
MLVNRFLIFECSGQQYGLGLAEITAVERIGTLRGIPGTSPDVLGLASRRGKVLTVLDVSMLLDAGRCDDGVILLLDRPFEKTALFVPSPVRLRSVPKRLDDGPASDEDGAEITILEVQGLVEAGRVRNALEKQEPWT